MFKVVTTAVFKNWLRTLKDAEAARHIQRRVAQVRQGNFGDHASVGGGVFELRFHHGPGYRVYFARRGLQIVLLLAGGDKSSQPRDIKLAQKLAREAR